MNTQCLSFILLAVISFTGFVITYQPPKKYATYHVAYMYQTAPGLAGYAALESTVEDTGKIDAQAMRQSIIRDSVFANHSDTVMILSIYRIR